MKDRYGLLQRGLFPETAPPCFTSADLKRALVGLVNHLKSNAHHRRPTDYIRYNGTKHDGSRRYFGSPNPISYFYVADFIAANWSAFENRFANSPFSVSHPRVAAEEDDRSIIIPSLSELTTIASKKLAYAPYILKSDIAQFFPSIYTHSIPWSAHGVSIAKADTNPESRTIIFNKLDFFVRNCQMAETRGVIVGPDAFRLVAEYVACGLDITLSEKISAKIIGAARHVDDYFIGLGGEPEALEALSALRDTLQNFALNINDSKTKIISGVEPLNEVWAQDLRSDARRLIDTYHSDKTYDIILFINKALELAKTLSSDSPVKIALRALDEMRIYNKDSWDSIEPYLLRTIFHHPHSIDYIALLVVKRIAIGHDVAREHWKSACSDLIRRHLILNHHHETLWLTWLLVSANLDISEHLVIELSNNDNAHIRAMVVGAYIAGKIKNKPPIRLGSKLNTTDQNWLLNLAAKSYGYSKANFSGALSAEFDHLSKKNIKLVDFQTYLESAKKSESRAISKTRYGYDTDDYDQESDEDYLDAGFFDPEDER